VSELRLAGQPSHSVLAKGGTSDVELTSQSGEDYLPFARIRS